MTDVVVVSNRGPVSFRLEAGRPVASGGGGGLAGTLRPLLTGSGATWVAAAMGEADRVAAGEGLMEVDGIRIVAVQPDPAIFQMAYEVIANGTLWFCHHHLFDLARRPRFDWHWHEAWAGYRSYNREFANAVIDQAPRGATVLVQDYHLSLVGSMLSEARPDLETVHFSHTPFAEPQMIEVLPMSAAGELLAGMAGFGACGFHTERWASAFRRAYANPALAEAAGTSEPPATFVSALGPAPQALATSAGDEATTKARRRLAEVTAGRRLIVRVDRIELSKNLLRGFYAFEELMETRPRWRGEVVFCAYVYPSRESLAEYAGYRSEVDHTVRRINERFGTDEWTPILYDPADDYPRSLAGLISYDVLLVNPIRDGMNMVAKEGPMVNERDGVLVLSRQAGAWEELSGPAIGVNPFDVTGTADALEEA
ncbi:MAG: alpha,alpha-trehalose-phosphate synthase (UDP-forming), partial [Acidimicrobiales bacterium]